MLPKGHQIPNRQWDVQDTILCVLLWHYQGQRQKVPHDPQAKAHLSPSKISNTYQGKKSSKVINVKSCSFNINHGAHWKHQFSLKLSKETARGCLGGQWWILRGRWGLRSRWPWCFDWLSLHDKARPLQVQHSYWWCRHHSNASNLVTWAELLAAFPWPLTRLARCFSNRNIH